MRTQRAGISTALVSLVCIAVAGLLSLAGEKQSMSGLPAAAVTYHRLRGKSKAECSGDGNVRETSFRKRR